MKEMTPRAILTFLSLFFTVGFWGWEVRASGRGRRAILGWGSRIQAGCQVVPNPVGPSAVAGVTSALALRLKHGDTNMCFLLSVAEFERQASDPFHSD